jgi:hypothetical protein
MSKFEYIEVNRTGTDHEIHDINGGLIGVIKTNTFGGRYLDVESPKDIYPLELLALVEYFVKTYWSDPDWQDFRDEVREALFMVLEKEGGDQNG